MWWRLKALETGLVPPIAHLDKDFQPDPDLGDLNLSRGGQYDPEFALRLGAGFGSQIAMTLVHHIPGEGERVDREKYQTWLSSISGYAQPELEVTQRTLRIKSIAAPEQQVLEPAWQYGQMPKQRAAWTGLSAQNATVEARPEIKPIQAQKPEEKPVVAAEPVKIVCSNRHGRIR